MSTTWHVERCLCRAGQAEERGQYALARRMLAPVLDREPENPDAWLLEARILGKTGHLAEALAILESLIVADPGNVAARMLLVGALLLQNETERAMDQLLIAARGWNDLEPEEQDEQVLTSLWSSYTDRSK
ncbi:MAG: tetratricopeptide repeat protein [Armatimonas sp.]